METSFNFGPATIAVSIVYVTQYMYVSYLCMHVHTNIYTRDLNGLAETFSDS
jgi:hypothetical protein